MHNAGDFNFCTEVVKHKDQLYSAHNLTSMIRKIFGGIEGETLFKSEIRIGNRKSELVSLGNYGELEIAISTEGLLWNRDVSGFL